MTISLGMITFDTTDAPTLARWWARQTDGRLDDAMGDGFVVVHPSGTGPILGFQQVEDPTPGKNRIHLDLSASDHDAEIERLVAEGATFVARHEEGGWRWVVLTDPDGNQFCLSGPHG
ncbi:VOC family protein [Cellulomonas edaphi]|uniref:VOC family protein n=1 Tax=Cellulomonas edaphi TaxID=3053468 RepID=A0ABT7S7F4_9CELL|nr:VOC family protein [Cellulomons edaphi]MDM7831531.1 VOC family protein [Cellulomons edaphi]